MAVMNKMREKMTVIFAGLAGAFLLMIIFEWGAQGDFFKTSRKPDEIGKVNGMSITNKDYDAMFQELKNQKLQEGKKTTLTETEENEIREKAWDQVVIQKLLEQQMDEYGVTVTDQEIRDVLFYNPPEFLKRNFTDSLGRFDEAAYFQALRDPHNDTVVAKLSTQMREELRKQKLSSLLQASIRTTRAELWDRYDATTSKATFDVVKLKPKKSSEYLSKVTEDEIKKYYDEHKFQYKQDEARKIKFVVFRELPTPKDSAMLMERIEGLKKKWMALPVDASDSVVSDLARDYTDAAYQPSLMLPPPSFNPYSNSDEIMNAKVGDVVTGTSQGQLRVMRILGSMDTGATYYHSKNILIGFGNPQNKDSAKALVQKLYNDIKAGGDFGALARQYSQDPSARNAGDMHWLGKNMYLPEFEAAAMKAPIGELQGPIETTLGYHIFIVAGRTQKTLKVATIPVNLHTSSQTQKMIQQQANIFREKASKDGFDQAARASNQRVTSDVPPITRKAQPLFGYRPFSNEIMTLSAGDITQPIRIPSAKLIVVAQVTEVVAEGYRPLDSNISSQIKTTLAKRKAVEDLAAKAKELRSKLSAGDDLGKLAAIDSNYKPFQVSAGPAESVGGLGTEYAVNNAAYAMKPGEISQPIEGESGYYIIKLIDLKPADQKMYDMQKTKEFETLTQEKQQRFFGQWIEGLKDKAKIVDYRSHRM
jgi:peptidyl-prolyl cis-trans isomerase D